MRNSDDVSLTVPVYSGYAPPDAILRVDLIGRVLTENSTKILIERRYSFTDIAVREIAREVKEKLPYFGAVYDTELTWRR